MSLKLSGTTMGLVIPEIPARLLLILVFSAANNNQCISGGDGLHNPTVLEQDPGHHLVSQLQVSIKLCYTIG